MIKTISSSH